MEFGAQLLILNQEIFQFLVSVMFCHLHVHNMKLFIQFQMITSLGFEVQLGNRCHFLLPPPLTAYILRNWDCHIIPVQRILAFHEFILDNFSLDNNALVQQSIVILQKNYFVVPLLLGVGWLEFEANCHGFCLLVESLSEYLFELLVTKLRGDLIPILLQLLSFLLLHLGGLEWGIIFMCLLLLFPLKSPFSFQSLKPMMFSSVCCDIDIILGSSNQKTFALS